ncbi:unnamed protein product [Polarella glacialis]|uniref:Uncharacterized protein n=1 Tax=Polarella glacialis TaxID=89957 RepID=A0A813HZH8_POLGL|nr:unnamed protein product [Polarella glacialis]
MIQHNKECESSGLPRTFRLLSADGPEWASTVQKRRQPDDHQVNSADKADWPKEVVLATSSLKLLVLGDDTLSEWILPALASVVRAALPEVDAALITDAEIRKRLNK